MHQNNTLFIVLVCYNRRVPTTDNAGDVIDYKIKMLKRSFRNLKINILQFAAAIENEAPQIFE